MRKQELIHLHGLFVEIRRHCEREEDVSLVLSEYESMDVDTSSIHRQKSEHRRAVLALSEAIAAELGEKRSETASATAG
jgi:hypothetical protein